MNDKELKSLQERVDRIELALKSALQSLHRSIPLTVIDQVPTADYPAYTQQQLWFFQAEITRWRNQNASQPGFAICSFRPGIPLHPLVFLPVTLVIKILEAMSKEVYETQGAAQLINDVQSVKRDLHYVKPERPLLDLPKENESLE